MAMLRSRGFGSREVAQRSCMYAWKTTPLAERVLSAVCASVAGRGSRVPTIAVRGDARGGANRVITFRRRDRILTVGGVLRALGGDGKRHGVAHRSVMRRHDDG